MLSTTRRRQDCISISTPPLRAPARGVDNTTKRDDSRQQGQRGMDGKAKDDDDGHQHRREQLLAGWKRTDIGDQGTKTNDEEEDGPANQMMGTGQLAQPSTAAASNYSPGGGYEDGDNHRMTARMKTRPNDQGTGDDNSGRQ